MSEACLSPPSARTGSMMTAATGRVALLFHVRMTDRIGGMGTYDSIKICSYSARHLASSLLLKSSFSFNGYLRSGKGAHGQSKAGISTCESGQTLHRFLPTVIRPGKTYLMYRFTSCSTQRPKESTVKSRFERKDR